MKTIRLLLAATFAACVLLLTGCASHVLDAASTSLKYSNGMGKTIEVTLPKNLDATKLKATVDPKTGVFSLEADAIKADGSTVIESATTAQADAISKLSEVVRTLAPQVAAAK